MARVDPIHPVPPPPPSKPTTPDGKKPSPPPKPPPVTIDPGFTVEYRPSDTPKAAPPKDGAPPPAPAPPTHSAMSVSLEQLSNAEKTALSGLTTLVASYTALRSTVDSQADTIFGQKLTWVFHDPNVEAKTWTTQVLPDPLAASGQAFAQIINPAMNQALDDLATALEVLGSFVKCLEAAGDGYAAADFRSQFGAAGPKT